jgi:hypothetical protein
MQYIRQKGKYRYISENKALSCCCGWNLSIRKAILGSCCWDARERHRGEEASPALNSCEIG